jgi:hypothetical protein
MAVPAAADEILEHNGEPPVGEHQLDIGPTHRSIGPPALLDDPALTDRFHLPVVESHRVAVTADLDPCGLHQREAAERGWDSGSSHGISAAFGGLESSSGLVVGPESGWLGRRSRPTTRPAATLGPLKEPSEPRGFAGPAPGS